MKLYANVSVRKAVDSPAEFASFIEAVSQLGEIDYVSAGTADPASSPVCLPGAAALAVAPVAETATDTKPKTRAKKTTEAAAGNADAATQTAGGTTDAASTTASASPSDKPASASLVELRAAAAAKIAEKPEFRPLVHAVIKQFSANKDEPKMSAIPDDQFGAALAAVKAIV